MAWNAVWEDIFKNQEWGKYPAESLIRFVARNFYARDRKNTRILEIGCGPGANVWYLAREGFDVYGVDGSATAIQKAADRLRSENLTADLTVGDIGRMAYEDNSFDAVVDNECLYCNSKRDTEGILKEVRRVLKNGGLLYSRTFTDEMYMGQKYQRSPDLEYTAISDGVFAGKGLARLLDREGIFSLYGSGFEIVSVDKLAYSDYNNSVNISEWIVICRKKD